MPVLLLSLILSGASSWAARIVLLENFHRGQLMQLEPNGRYSHVAIGYGRYWLHAHRDIEGVELTDEIERFGRNPLYLENEITPEPTRAQVEVT